MLIRKTPTDFQRLGRALLVAPTLFLSACGSNNPAQMLSNMVQGPNVARPGNGGPDGVGLVSRQGGEETTVEFNCKLGMFNTTDVQITQLEPGGFGKDQPSKRVTFHTDGKRIWGYMYTDHWLNEYFSGKVNPSGTVTLTHDNTTQPDLFGRGYYRNINRSPKAIGPLDGAFMDLFHLELVAQNAYEIHMRDCAGRVGSYDENFESSFYNPENNSTEVQLGNTRFNINRENLFGYDSKTGQKIRAEGRLFSIFSVNENALLGNGSLFEENGNIATLYIGDRYVHLIYNTTQHRLEVDSWGPGWSEQEIKSYNPQSGDEVNRIIANVQRAITVAKPIYSPWLRNSFPRTNHIDPSAQQQAAPNSPGADPLTAPIDPGTFGLGLKASPSTGQTPAEPPKRPSSNFTEVLLTPENGGDTAIASSGIYSRYRGPVPLAGGAIVLKIA